MRAVRLLIWTGSALLCGAMLLSAVHGIWPPAGKAAISLAASLAGITIGLVVWDRRPESRTGLFLTAYPLAGLLADLGSYYWGSSFAMTIALATSWLAAPIFGQLVLTYPTGRFTSRLDRALVEIAYGAAGLYALVFLVFVSPRSLTDSADWHCWVCAPPVTQIASRDLTGTHRIFDWIFVALALALLVLLFRRLVRATPAGRRVVLPLAVATCALAVEFLVQTSLYGTNLNTWTSSAWFVISTVTDLAVSVALAAGLLWLGRGRGAVAGLVVELQQTPPGGVRDALARTLGDPSLELALWLPERSGYVDGAGRPVELPELDSRRAVTVLGPSDSPVAALVHDPVLLERPALLASAGAAARLSLENERLQAELRAQLAELHASRARIVSAGDEERRRLERDLHDGAQQRLLSLGIALQLLRGKLGVDANGAGELLDEADDELRAALDELRELARGIHPAVLTDEGLGAALRSLAGRSAVSVTIAAIPDDRLPAATEAAAYFVVSEALTNVAKYAGTAEARVSVSRRNGRMLVDVEDDGVGGADPSRGTGLRGLADRVHALDGVLELDSPPGHGTRLHAEIPCA